MNVDYNPQTGYRRTLFEENFDFLLKPLSAALSSDKKELRFTVQSAKGTQVCVLISFPQEDAFRFRICKKGEENIPANPVKDTMDSLAGRFCEKEDVFEYSLGGLLLSFRKEYWEMSVFYDKELLTKEQFFDTNVDNRWKVLPTGFVVKEDGTWESVFANMYLFSREEFWGFGERFTDFGKRGQKLSVWQKDALSTNTQDSYKGHPFFISSRGYAVLLNTFSRAFFDMGNTSSVSWTMEAQDKALDYILFANKDRDYGALTHSLVRFLSPTCRNKNESGIPLIPSWAFGFWLSRCSYQSREEIEEVLTRAKKEGLKVDVIHLDEWQKRGYDGLWEWDTDRFPDPPGMIKELNEKGIHLSLWNYPYLTESSPAFPDLEARGFFVKTKEGKTARFYATADAREKCACFDFTNPQMVTWYVKRLEAVLDDGVEIIKTDFSEALPEDALFYDGSSGIEGHNRLTWLYAKTVYETMRVHAKKGGKMPLLWCRSGFVGSYAIPAAWAGDSSSAVNNHASILRGGLSLALSGVAYWGFDMGGFYWTGVDGDETLPPIEDYLRSMELGFWMPLCRTHGKTPREPWVFGEKPLSQVRHWNTIRHRLAPYFCDLACEAHKKSLPMLRPLLLEFPHDAIARVQDLEFMLGESLLIAPSFDDAQHEVYLPSGNWYDLRKKCFLKGGRYQNASSKIGEMPLYLRGDKILPLKGKGSAYDLVIFLCQGIQKILSFYDEQGNITEKTIRANIGQDGWLFIETSLPTERIFLLTERAFCGISINGVCVQSPLPRSFSIDDADEENYLG